MKKGCLIVLLALAVLPAVGADKMVSGSVTYVSAGAVYTSIGRDAGVKDSALVYLLTGSDTTVTMQIIAISSKSSLCKVLRGRREVRVGDVVTAKITAGSPSPTPGVTTGNDQDVVSPPGAFGGSLPERSREHAAPPAWVTLSGRISSQIFATRYENSAYNITQPGLVTSLKAKARDIPLTFDFYGNIRMQAYGNESPFSRSARNQSRIYRLSLEYNDGMNIASLGRIVPTFSPTLGAIDGVLLARRVGNVLVGSSFGFQPGFSQRGTDTDYRKGAAFVSFEMNGASTGSVTATYARSYFQTTLDREVASVYAYFMALGRLSVYANSEVDLRKKSGDGYILSPSLTTIFMTVNYRFTRVLSLGIGGDASRPLYTYQAARAIPDSLINRTLRAGVTFHMNLYLPGGISLYNTYTPRSGDGSFAKNYSDYASLTFSNIASSGITLRSNVNFNENEFTRSTGYGGFLQHHFFDSFDLTLRYQQYMHTVKRLGERNTSTTLGADLIVPITRSLSLMTSYDRLRGYGADSHSVFAEFSVRF